MEADSIAQQLQKLIAFSKGEHTNWELLLPLLEADSLRVRVGAYKLLRDRSNYPHIDHYLIQHIPYEVFTLIHKIPKEYRDARSGKCLIPFDGKSLMRWFADGTISRFDPFTGDRLNSSPPNREGGGLVCASAIDPDGNHIYQGMTNGKVRVLDYQQRVITKFLEPYSHNEPRFVPPLDVLACDPCGKFLVGYVSRTATLFVWDLDSGKAQNYNVNPWETWAGLTSNGRYAIFRAKEGFRTFDLQKRQMQDLIPSNLSRFALTSHMGHSLIGGADGVIQEQKIRDGAVIHESRLSPQISQSSPHVLAIAPDGKTVLIMGNTHDNMLWDFRSHRVYRRRITSGGVLFSPNGQFFIVDNSGFEIWAIRSTIPKLEDLTPDEELYAVMQLCTAQWSDDRSMCAIAPTEEALIYNFMAVAKRHGYHFGVDDIRKRVVYRKNWDFYYYTIGKEREIPWCDLNPQLEQVEHFRPIPLDNPEHYPF